MKKWKRMTNTKFKVMVTSGETREGYDQEEAHRGPLWSS